MVFTTLLSVASSTLKPISSTGRPSAVAIPVAPKEYAETFYQFQPHELFVDAAVIATAERANLTMFPVTLLKAGKQSVTLVDMVVLMVQLARLVPVHTNAAVQVRMFVMYLQFTDSRTHWASPGRGNVSVVNASNTATSINGGIGLAWPPGRIPFCLALVRGVNRTSLAEFGIADFSLACFSLTLFNHCGLKPNRWGQSLVSESGAGVKFEKSVHPSNQ